MDSVWPELDVLVVDTGEGDSLNVLNLGDFLRILKTQQ
jgi:hypothetical protein